MCEKSRSKSTALASRSRLWARDSRGFYRTRPRRNPKVFMCSLGLIFGRARPASTRKWPHRRHPHGNGGRGARHFFARNPLRSILIFSFITRIGDMQRHRATGARVGESESRHRHRIYRKMRWRWRLSGSLTLESVGLRVSGQLTYHIYEPNV